VQIGFAGRSDAQRDVGHRASIATHPKIRFAPPKAGFLCVVAASRFLSDVPHRMAKRSLPQRKIIPVKRFRMIENRSSANNEAIEPPRHLRYKSPLSA
jgi:hypothetical protein